MAETLFDMAFRAWNAPVQAEIQQQNLAMEKLNLQSGMVDLQNKIGLQQDLKKIIGTDGLTGIEQAVGSGDISQSPKLIAVAQAMAAHGQPQAAMSMLGSLSLMGMRASETRKYQQQVEWRTAERTGSILGQVKGPDDYTQAMTQLQAEGINPQTLGLTGNDWAKDGPRLKQIANSAMTRAQQLQAADRQTAEADRNSHFDINAGFAQQRLGQQAQRIQISLDGLGLRQQEFAHREVQDDRKDSRYQEGLDEKDMARRDKIYTSNAKPMPSESNQALGIFTQDTRTAGLAPPIQKALAEQAARAAKLAVARDMRNAGDPDVPEGAFEQHLAEAMNKMEKRGDFEHAGSSDFKFAPPPATAHAPVKPPLPEKGTQGVPKGIPAGSKVVGKSPDGKAVWQDPSGKKWVE